jgi:hypothetical protein
MTQSVESMIEVLQAFQSGKDIQYSYDDGKTWRETDQPAWNFDTIQYRIAPEPKKKVHYSCWSDEGQLRWIADPAAVPADWIRVPSEDKEILL